MKNKVGLLIRSYELGKGKTPCVSLWIPADADPEIRKVIAILQLSEKNHEDHDGTIVWEGVKFGDEFTTQTATAEKEPKYGSMENGRM